MSNLHFISPVYDSFKEYIAVETLSGDNKYDAGEHGLQVTLKTMLSATTG